MSRLLGRCFGAGAWAVLAALALAPANADPLYFNQTGHYYEAVDSSSVNWVTANATAESLSYQGMPGHLVTITSQAENDFVSNTVLANVTWRYHWIGGFQPAGSQEPGGGWVWVTGETWSYSHWNGGEPNNNGSEDAALIYSGATPYRGYWNDENSSSRPLPNEEPYGFVVEYEAGSNVVPEPFSMAFLGSAFVGVVAFRLRRRKKAS